MDFKHFFFVQIHLKKSHSIFALRITLFDRPALFLSHVPCNINIFVLHFSFASIYLPRGPHNFVRPNQIFALKQKVLLAPVALTILTKHAVRPQRR